MPISSCGKQPLLDNSSKIFQLLVKPRWQRLVFRVIVLAGIWFGLNGFDAKSWLIGIPAVVLAALINFRSLPRGSWRWQARAILPMLAFFFKESFLGAFDVARRAFRPDLPIQPGFIAYRCRLTSTSARLFFADLITLMPGTLSARADDADFLIHCLDTRGDVDASLQKLELKVADLFGLSIHEEERPL